jgi:hypothetical protein
MGVATMPENSSPALLTLEFKVAPRMMGMAVPAGTTKGCGGPGTGSGAGGVCCGVELCASLVEPGLPQPNCNAAEMERANSNFFGFMTGLK